jgi:hypothetical protein
VTLQVTAHAASPDIDLIVIGTHGHTALPGAGPGSLAAAAVRRVTGRVLTRPLGASGRARLRSGRRPHRLRYQRAGLSRGR